MQTSDGMYRYACMHACLAAAVFWQVEAPGRELATPASCVLFRSTCLLVLALEWYHVQTAIVDAPYHASPVVITGKVAALG